ncbi:GNAT family N-acetyltransferase [Marinomonas ostreistagni]|uniref:GNAT family N-acetyltransferase n=1 Tax=Marinomonas ostreistagni TaxID=359209 RepID=UPI00194E927D|nr:GNAT family N-acetyltransferase [Marinomonas ostreistagni]MBM6551050.1 GNAT family N-acetyltransferase [Marinomonas ostreistagni]
MFVLAIWEESREEVFMLIDDNIQIIDIDNSEDLIKYIDGISELFLESFSKPLDVELWEWAYVNNPFGEPIVSLAISNDKVIGHYAVIPCTLSCSKGEIQGYLSMTTMVAAAYRKYKLFQLLANRVYDKIESKIEPSVVFGFPNNNSAPGFRKRLGWTIDLDYKVIELSKQVQDYWRKRTSEENYKEKYTLFLNGDVKNWRMKKPKQEWSIKKGVGLKRVHDSLDLMYVEDPVYIADIADIAELSKVYTILPIPDSKEEELNCKVAFSYRFGYRFFNYSGRDDVNFFVQMCMSDVF